MPSYRRAFSPGGTFFFTVVTYDRQRFLCERSSRSALRTAIESCRAELPFTIDAWVLLPDHLHAIWTLPDGDSDFSTRWSIIKRLFTKHLLSQRTEPFVTTSRRANRRRGIWQRRFWEHKIRDTEDLNRHLDYIHYNPVKHQLA